MHKGDNHKYLTILSATMQTGILPVLENIIPREINNFYMNARVTMVLTVSTEAGTAKTVKGM